MFFCLFTLLIICKNGFRAIANTKISHRAWHRVMAEKKTRRKKYTADDFAGIWDDEHYMAAEDINKAIRDARHVKSSREGTVGSGRNTHG